MAEKVSITKRIKGLIIILYSFMAPAFWNIFIQDWNFALTIGCFGSMVLSWFLLIELARRFASENKE